MALRFTIIDYTNDANGISTQVKEPVGWDGISVRLKRDKTWHGFFDFFDDSYSNMQWIGEARDILKAAYDKNGIEAYCELSIEFACSDTSTYDQLYYGRFAFDRYNDVCGDLCYVTCGVESSNCLMTFRNRYDQKVDLDSLIPFDNCACGDVLTVGGGFTAATSEITITSVAGYLPEDLKCLKIGDKIMISGTADNDGEYTISTFGLGGTTTITTVEPLVDGIDGSFQISGCLLQTELAEYNGLSKTISIPSKQIELSSKWMEKSDKVYDMEVDWADDIDLKSITPDWTNILSDIKNTLVGTATPSKTQGFFDDSPPDAIIEYTDDSQLKCANNAALEISISGMLTPHGGCDDANYNITDFLLIVNAAPDWTPADWTGQTAGPNKWIFTLDPSGFTLNTTIVIPNFDFGNKLWFRFVIQQQNIGDGSCYADLMINSGSYLSFKILSECEKTDSDVYLVNEALSRITEVYTADCLRVKSDYFGRTDSQPYESEQTGCAGLECLTSGLKIRNALMQDGLPARMFLSMKDAFDGLNAIHNIGMGVELDEIRGGDSQWLRVEPIEYFYKNDVILELEGIAELKREFDTTKVFSTAKIGYDKWETESVNGLNDVFGNREYRTSLKQIRNEYTRLCNFIASDYAIEVTRRAFGDTTKDWRYDNNTFIICLKNDYTGTVSFNASTKIINLLSGITQTEIQVGDTLVVTGTLSNDGTYTVTNVANNGLTITVAESLTNETVFDTCHIEDITRPLQYYPEQNNVDSSSNILYPETCLNLRITPARNAIRHLKSIFQSYTNYSNGRLIFTSGNGNFIARINLNDGDCILEGNNVSEDGDLYAEMLTDVSVAAPIYKPEKIIFEYPITWEQYLLIRENPYGLIGYQCGSGDIEYGWIEDFQLKPTGPNGGLGQFTLKPQTIV